MDDKRFDQINMVPFIDVVLVLLAIVMTTASFVAQGLIDVNLPESQTATAQPNDGQSIEIAIKADNQIFYEGEVVDKIQLADLLSREPQGSKFLLRIDKTADFQQFVTVFDALKQQHFDDVAVETLL